RLLGQAVLVREVRRQGAGVRRGEADRGAQHVPHRPVAAALAMSVGRRSPFGVTMTALGIAALGCGGGTSDPSGRDWERHPAVVTVTGAGAIDVLGDLHGDPEVTTRMLAAAGLTTST